MLDALACLVVAGRLHRGQARAHPNPYAHDGHGLPIAIWS
jgi:predicted RNase H-like nuclease